MSGLARLSAPPSHAANYLVDVEGQANNIFWDSSQIVSQSTTEDIKTGRGDFECLCLAECADSGYDAEFQYVPGRAEFDVVIRDRSLRRKCHAVIGGSGATSYAAVQDSASGFWKLYGNGSATDGYVQAVGTGTGTLHLGTNGDTVAIGGPGSHVGIPQATWADNQTCTTGQISVDASYIYVCTATNTVKRAALSTF
jgi:hypothetical protein